MNQVHAHEADSKCLVHVHPGHLNEHGNWGGPVDVAITAEARTLAEAAANADDVFAPALIREK